MHKTIKEHAHNFVALMAVKLANQQSNVKIAI
jgi:hypothetical protein